MSIDSYSTDPSSGIRGNLRQKGIGAGPIVFTDTAREWMSNTKSFVNPTYGAEFAQNGAFSGTPVRVHDGIDTTLWTGANVTGTTATFNSTNQAQAGTRSTEWLSANLGSIIEYDKGTGSIAVNSYAALTIYVYVSSTWGSGDELIVYLYDQGTGLPIGSPVDLRGYIDVATTGAWQRAVIRLEDFAAPGQTFDTIRFEVTGRSGTFPSLYFDEIVIQEQGALVYSLDLDPRKAYLIDKLRVTIAATGTGDVFAYNEFFGEALTSGIAYRRVTNGETAFSVIINDISDFLHLGFSERMRDDDGVETLFMFESEFPWPIELNNLGEDNISFTVSDDLSGLLYFKILAVGREEPQGSGKFLL